MLLGTIILFIGVLGAEGVWEGGGGNRMTNGEWDELETSVKKGKRYKELLAMTEKEDEHPEDYNGPCLCRLCMSYAGGG